MEMTEKQRAFVDEMFLNGFDRKKAYSLVFPDCKPANVPRTENEMRSLRTDLQPRPASRL